MYNEAPSSQRRTRAIAILEALFWLLLLVVFVVAAIKQISIYRTSNAIAGIFSENYEILEHLHDYQRFGALYESKLSGISEIATPTADLIDELKKQPIISVAGDLFASFAPMAGKLFDISFAVADTVRQTHQQLEKLTKLQDLEIQLTRLSKGYDRQTARSIQTISYAQRWTLEKFRDDIASVNKIITPVEAGINELSGFGESTLESLGIESELTVRLFESLANLHLRLKDMSQITNDYSFRIDRDLETIQKLSDTIVKSEQTFERIDQSGIAPLVDFVIDYALILVPLICLIGWQRRSTICSIFSIGATEFISMTNLSNQKLLSVSNKSILPAQQVRVVNLLEQQKLRYLNRTERSELRNLIEDFEQTVLQRARALAILAYRGYENVQNRQSTTPPQTD